MKNPWLNSLLTRVHSIIGRGVVTHSKNTPGLRRLQVQIDGRLYDGIEQWETYGFSSRPHDGAESLLVAQGGSRSAAVSAATPDRRYQPPNLAKGEAAMWDNLGNFVHFKQDGSVHVRAIGPLNIVAPSVHITGDLTVTGDINGLQKIQDGQGTIAQSMQQMRNQYNAHSHPGASGPPTEPM